MNINKQTVLVAMSGGVDSSVAAGLLLEQGFQVVGITLLFRPCNDSQNVSWCCGQGAAENAMSVCRKLNIRHYTVDCSSEFESKVLRYSWQEYQRGRTPNPCIHCNTHIKFAIMQKKAKSLGADFIATGHYAGLIHGEIPILSRAEFAPKDQTYFLFALDREILNKTLFPLGTLSKPKVRELAAKWNFSNAKRPESQDACFVSEGNSFAEALRERFNEVMPKGYIENEKGEILGTHRGIHQYTIGQRRGLRIAQGYRAYVTKIDAQKNAVILSEREESLLSRGLIADNITWTGGYNPTFPLHCNVQIRYRSAPTKAEITIENNQLRIVFESPCKAAAPGQAAVLYDENRVLGGGWISRTLD